MQAEVIKDKEIILPQKREREVGIDALKMLSMFLVVLLHILGHGGVLSAFSQRSAAYHIAWIIEIGAYCAVNCYGLVSGYVSIGSEKYKYSNILYLWLQVLFYMVGITLIFAFIKPGVITDIRIRAALFPVIFRQYWYFTAYFLVFLMMPALNLLIDNLSKKASRLFISLSVIVLCVPQIFFNRDPFALEDGYSAVWLAVLYLIGAYFKKYDVLKKLSALKWFVLYILAVAVTWLFKSVTEKYGITIEYFISLNSMSFVSYLSPTILLSAISLMGVCVHFKPKKGLSKVITLITPFTFGVYLIHVHQLIWEEVRGTLMFLVEKPLVSMVFGIFLIAITVFLACVIIDAVRELIFKALHLKQLVMWFEKKFIGDIWKDYRRQERLK